MLDILKYATSDFWVFCGSIAFAWIFTTAIVRIISRTMRMLMVRNRGWPPAHLDADGDYIDLEDEEEE